MNLLKERESARKLHDKHTCIHNMLEPVAKRAKTLIKSKGTTSEMLSEVGVAAAGGAR